MDAVILGAGAAGLAAARTLSQAGLTVQIIEARSRIGGRIHTLHDPFCPVPIELGAEFVHGAPPEIMREVLPAATLESQPWCFRDGRLQRCDDFFERVDGVIGKMDGAPEQSAHAFLEASHADAETREWAESYVEGFHAARTEWAGIHGIARAEAASGQVQGDRTFRLTGGYRTLVERLVTGMSRNCVRLECDTVVESVAWRRGWVEVTARRFGETVRFEAPKAIVTLPLGVLQSGIAFEPRPVILEAACKGLAMGHAIRMVLRFHRPVWEEREELRKLGFLLSQEEWMPTWWTSLPASAPVITGWMGGPRAETAAQRDPAEWVTPSLRTLGRLLEIPEERLRAELECWHAHNWSADPFSLGAYSYVKVGGVAAQERFGDPVEDTLYFAGEAAVPSGEVGTVHGAIASGERSARLAIGLG